jgi:putative DNA primase/helicase
MLAAGISWAVASGSDFLRWKATETCGVLYLDGELPADLLRERLLMQQSASEQTEVPPIKILSHEQQRNGILTLATPQGRKEVERRISDDISLVVFDNLSCLYGGEENDAEGWQEMQEFLLRLRRRGIACIVIHHSGKGGQQRGTSRREDVLDTVINLKHPNGYKAEEGARFEVHFEKARGLSGDEVEPFEAQLTTTDDGHPIWIAKSLHPEKDKALELMRKDLGDEEIGQVVGKDRSTINRWRNNFKKSGVL